MSVQLQNILLSLPPEDWRIKQIIVLDWYDGPREGLCEMLEPHCCFHFKLLAEKMVQGKGVDGLFCVSEAPMDAIVKMLDYLSELGHPTSATWTPIWIFPNEVARLAAERKIELLLSNLIKTNIMLQTKDMDRFSGYWIAYA
jgi:hypothetical protein